MTTKEYGTDSVKEYGTDSVKEWKPKDYGIERKVKRVMFQLQDDLASIYRGEIEDAWERAEDTLIKYIKAVRNGEKPLREWDGL